MSMLLWVKIYTLPASESRTCIYLIYVLLLIVYRHADFDWVRLGAWQSALLDVIHYAEQSPTATSALVNAVEERTTMPISNFGTHNGLCRKQTEEEEEWSCEAAE